MLSMRSVLARGGSTVADLQMAGPIMPCSPHQFADRASPISLQPVFQVIKLDCPGEWSTGLLVLLDCVLVALIAEIPGV
jgi:hypothetical protein